MLTESADIFKIEVNAPVVGEGRGAVRGAGHEPVGDDGPTADGPLDQLTVPSPAGEHHPHCPGEVKPADLLTPQHPCHHSLESVALGNPSR